MISISVKFNHEPIKYPEAESACTGAIVTGSSRGAPERPKSLRASEVLMVPPAKMDIAGTDGNWKSVSFPYGGKLRGPLRYAPGDPHQDANYREVLSLRLKVRMLAWAYAGFGVCVLLSTITLSNDAPMASRVLIVILTALSSCIAAAVPWANVDRERTRIRRTETLFGSSGEDEESVSERSKGGA